MQEQREEFVRLAASDGANVAELCRRFGISRKTGYKWLGRETLENRSRRPHHSPSRTAGELQAKAIAIRKDHPAWGGRKIARVLARDEQLRLAPSTVNSLLKRNGLISSAASQAASPWQRFEHDAPNVLWQMDFKGHFATDAQRCHALTVLDDHSRFNLVLQALGDERRESVQHVLQQTFERYGLPQRINTDNGAPWGSVMDRGLTTLGVWLIRLGVQLSHSRPYHPQTNGKDERFHRTLKAEVLSARRFADLHDVQQHFSCWRHVYNFKRPHQALDMAAPSSRYTPSPRSMPSTLAPIEYGPEDTVRQVTGGGRITFKGNILRVGRALIGQPVALRPRLDEDGVYDVYFCHQRIETLDLGRQPS